MNCFCYTVITLGSTCAILEGYSGAKEMPYISAGDEVATRVHPTRGLSPHLGRGGNRGA